jgi:sialate O-acetylesterase
MRTSVLIFLMLNACSAFAAVQPAGLFADYAVLQQGEPVRIWGTASPEEKITVTFAEQVEQTVAGPDGNWMVVLKKMPANAEGRSLILQGSETKAPVEIKQVVVGEVWLAGGQSNMQTTMSVYSRTTQADIDRAGDPLLRIARIPQKGHAGQKTSTPKWELSTPAAAAGFSATAYYFARDLRSALGVPVGIVTCAVGGTPAEAWTSRKSLESQPELKRILDGYELVYRENFKSDEDYLKYMDEHNAAMKEWRRKQAAKETPNPYPKEKMGPQNLTRPCGLYESMFTQTIPYTFRGVIWYQGENNAGDQNSFLYRKVFSALSEQWREDLQNKNLPFLFVELPPYGPTSDTTPYWPELRDSQRWVEENIKHTGMAVLADGGEVWHIHPHSKDKAGYRLSLLARNLVYGEKELVCRGPRLKQAKIGKGGLELSFKDIGSGLVLKLEAVSAFEICGKDGNYVPAKAELVDGKIVVSAGSIPEPQYVRYGWQKWFVPSLFNAEGLPASPFRTDDFPAITRDRYYLDR